MNRSLISIAALLLLGATWSLAADTQPRLFFSDAKLSFTIPETWQMGDTFPYGPLLTRETQEGSTATIVCQISDSVDASRFSASASTDMLKDFATRDLTRRATDARTVASAPRSIAGQNAYELTWLVQNKEEAVQSQSIYFFLDNRFYVLTLSAARDSFPWLVQEYQSWLNQVHILSRQASGKLIAPSFGGIWVHQTGGVRIEIPGDWLIGVADDRQLGATIARDKMSLAFTAVVDSLSGTPRALSAAEKEEARRALKSKDRKLALEGDEPFHGLPAYQIVYEYSDGARFVRGQDIWVVSPKARWLISIEGDSKLMRQLADDWQTILKTIHFAE